MRRRGSAAILAVLAQAAMARAQTPAPTPNGPATQPAAPDPPRLRRIGGGEEAPAPPPPDLSAAFDPFGPDGAPPPRAPRFDPARPSLAAADDPLAAVIRNGPGRDVLPPAAADEPWRLPGVRRAPTLADPSPGSAPATKPGVGVPR